MGSNDQYDVIIVGTGAGGGTLAQALASTGKRILLLERGDFLPREKENWDPGAVFNQGRYKTKEVWYDSKGNEFHPGTHYYVGGNTKVYGATLLRLRKEDFGELKHHGGISPAWPVGYDEFEPYYVQAEKLYSVHGEHGVDPTEPEASQPYAHPPLSHEPRIQELFDDLKKLGHRPFPLPVGIRLNEEHPEKSQCIRCDTCDGFPCLVNAKADSHTTCVNPALEHSNVTLQTNSKVIRLKTDASGKSVSEVEVEHNGAIESYSAGVVALCCGAINSAAVLLRSANDKHPSGLANSSDLVGRNYMCHNNSAIVSVSRDANFTKFQKTLGLNDFYFGSPDWDYPLGHIQLLGKAKKEMLEGDAPMMTPGLALDYMANHSVDWWITSEDLPDPKNRVTVNSKGDITLHYEPNNAEPHKRLLAKLKETLKEVGLAHHVLPSSVYLSKKIPLAGVAHQVGTCRFGTDPEKSVLDGNCKAHDLDNLYIVDGAFFPSSSAVNPGLTIIANALRVADHLKERLG